MYFSCNRQSLKMDLVFCDVNVSINGNQILKNVSGMAKQGDMLAVMGPSGAGKSTLLNSVSGRASINSGRITLNGEPINRKMRRKICYVMQQDVFFSNLTLHETLTYTAMLRLPDTMPAKLKQQRVQDIVEILDLKKCLNTVMGGAFMTGLSGGEKKRASIACELITNPSLIMLDEPTSGLDSAIAYQLMRTMKSYTEQSKKTVIATIHQPSSQIFHMFDNVLLLAEGQVAYFGKGSKILDFFSSLNLSCMPHYNPADFILEKVKDEEEVVNRIITAANSMRMMKDWPKELISSRQSLIASQDLPDVKVVDSSGCSDKDDEECNGTSRLLGSQGKLNTLLKDGEEVQLNGIIVDNKCATEVQSPDGKENGHLLTSPGAADSHNIESYYVEGQKWQTGFMTQYKALTQRGFFQAKNRILSKLNIFQTLLLSLFCGVVWWQTPRTEETLNDRNGLLFFMIVYFSFVPMFDIITSFPEERAVITRERSAGAYRLSAYYLAKMTSESPLVFALPVAYITIVYWMAGFSVHAGSYILQIALFLYHSLVSQSIGMIIGVTFLDFKLSITVAACFMLTSLLAGGYYQSNFPFWMEWAKYASYLQYSFQTSLIIEYENGAPIQCSPPSMSMFEACSANVTSEVSGDHYLEVSGNTLPIWLNLLVLFAFFLLLRIGGYLVLRYYRTPHRKN